MPCHMQPELHQQPALHQPLVGRCWAPSCDDDLVARKGKAQLPPTSVSGKKSPSLELSNDVNKQKSAGKSHADKVDIDTQTG